MRLLLHIVSITAAGLSLASCQGESSQESSLLDSVQAEEESAPRYSYEFFYDHTEESRFIDRNYPNRQFSNTHMALFHRNAFRSRIKRTDNETGRWTVIQSDESGPRYAEVVMDIARQHYWGRGVTLDQALTDLKNALIHYVHLLRGGLATHQEKVDEYEENKQVIRDRLAWGQITEAHAEALLTLDNNQIGYLQRDMALIQARLDKVLSILNAPEMEQVDYDWQTLSW